MPVIMFTMHEVFDSAITASRDLSARILKLTDLNANPLAPGETADNRRHQIAKLGKALAETFLTLDKLMENAAKQMAEQQGESDVTAGPVGGVTEKSDNPNSN
jgi:hypothetical protein